MFSVGQKVCCVDAKSVVNLLREGAIYTIASIRWVGADESPDDAGLGVTLIEVPTRETEQHFAEFRAERFRPVVARKTDISIFTKMLTPSLNHQEAEGVGR